MKTEAANLLGLVGAAGCVIMMAFACATGEYPDESEFNPVETFGTDGTPGTGTEGDTEILPEDGFLWCTRRANAEYTDPFGDHAVLYPQLDAPEGCICVAPEVDVMLDGLLMSGEVPYASLTGSLTMVRDDIYDASATECVSLVPLQSMGGDPWPNNCENDESLDTIPGTHQVDYPGIYKGNRESETECTFARIYEEMVGSSYCAFMDGSYDVALNHGVYEIDQALFDSVMQYPGCLLYETGRVDFAGGSNYEFTRIANGDLLYVLGLRNDDKPKSINGMPLNTIDNAFNAFDVLRETSETEFTFKVTRGLNQVTFQYEVVP